MNIDVPKERPSWDQLVEIAMQHALYEGFWPTDVDADELQDYIDICKKKEEYGQKVRNDLRKNLDQCAKMWVYLDQIKKLGEFKASAADVILEKKAAKTSESPRASL